MHRVVGTDEFARWELAEDLTGHHHHLICASCGRVEDVPASAGLERSVAAAAAPRSRAPRASAPSGTASTSSACARAAGNWRPDSRLAVSDVICRWSWRRARSRSAELPATSAARPISCRSSGRSRRSARPTTLPCASTSTKYGYPVSPYAAAAVDLGCRPSSGTASPHARARPTAGSSAAALRARRRRRRHVDAVSLPAFASVDDPRHLGLAVRAPVREEHDHHGACRSARW